MYLFPSCYSGRNMFRTTVVILFGCALVAARRDPFYRKDYTYVEQYDAFYKVHWDLSGYSWGAAFLACDDEEATLFYPKVKDEWAVVKSLVSSMTVKPNVSEIFVGIHDEFGLGELMTVDGLPTPAPVLEKDQAGLVGQSACVAMDIATGTYKLDSCETENLKPFVCKKKIGESCPTVDKGYTLVEPMKKCYKVNQRKKSWVDAMQTCFMEGGMLAVVANQAEADIIHNNIRDADERFFVGFRRMFPNGDFYTVKGQKMSDHIYQRWYSNFYDETRSDCGVVHGPDNNNLFTSTKNCLEPSPFICEMTTSA